MERKSLTKRGRALYKERGVLVGDGQFMAPAGIAVDASGNIYVTDTENRRVQIFRLLEEP